MQNTRDWSKGLTSDDVKVVNEVCKAQKKAIDIRKRYIDSVWSKIESNPDKYKLQCWNEIMHGRGKCNKFLPYII